MELMWPVAPYRWNHLVERHSSELSRVRMFPVSGASFHVEVLPSKLGRNGKDFLFRFFLSFFSVSCGRHHVPSVSRLF